MASGLRLRCGHCLPTASSVESSLPSLQTRSSWQGEGVWAQGSLAKILRWCIGSKSVVVIGLQHSPRLFAHLCAMGIGSEHRPIMPCAGEVLSFSCKMELCDAVFMGREACEWLQSPARLRFLMEWVLRAEHVVLLRSLSSVPLTFLATSRYRASSISFVQLVSLLMPLLFSGAIALLFLSWL